MTAHQLAQARDGVRIKSIALPAEHGGWGLLFEPIVLGLLLAPSIAGLYLGLSALGFFLARHPLTLVILNRRRKSPRTALAQSFAAVYLIGGATSLIAAISFTEISFALPLLIAAPLGMVQLAHDWTGRRRLLWSELAGAIAILSIAPAIALSGGWSSSAAFALWAIMIARAVPAILYVRAVLARLHRRPASPLPMVFAHGLAIAAVAVLMRAQLAPRIAVALMIILLARAVIGFARLPRLTARQIGFSEIAFGAVTVFGVVLGQAFGI